MAALTQNVGTQATGEDNETGGPVEGGNLAGLGAVLSKQKKIDVTHSNLTRFYWTRLALEQALKANPGASVEVVYGRDMGRKSARNLFHLRITPPLAGNSVPWIEYEKDFDGVAFFGAPEKMAAPSWDLPAGAVKLGGTCPGAAAGQSTLPAGSLRSNGRTILPILQAASRKDEIGYPEKIEVANAICQSCYANANSFAYADNQFGMVLRYWWTETMLSTEAGRAQWVETMVQAIEAQARSGGWRLEAHSASPDKPLGADPCAESIQFRPFRLHSSGDFFSADYANAWMDVMSDPRVQALRVIFWAPTRSWITGIGDTFRKRHKRGTFPGNLVLRPSGYHFGDQSPALGAPFAAGTTSLYAVKEEKKEVTFVERGEGKKPLRKTKKLTVLSTPPADTRRKWDCQTYAVVDAQHSCPEARGSNGEPGSSEGGAGCRTCWLYRDVSVQYTAHG